MIVSPSLPRSLSFGITPSTHARIAWGKLAALSMILLAISGLALAQAGTLDPSFGMDGRVITQFNGQSTVLSGAALQSDGKIVVAGSVSAETQQFAVVRYTADGKLDTNFGNGGVATSAFDNAVLSQANAVAVQEDGKIVAAGGVVLGEFAGVARYNSDGSLDTSFGSAGTIMATPFGPNSSVTATALAIQPNGKILIAGQGFLMRFDTHGIADATFGNNGVAPLAGDANSIAIQKDNKIVVAASDATGGNGVLSRYNSNGSLDNSFGIVGRAPTVTTTSAVALQSDGKIVIAGTMAETLLAPPALPDLDFAVVRYNTNGSIDTSFGNRGAVLTDLLTNIEINIQESSSAYALAIQPDGKIVAAGQVSRVGKASDFGVIRCLTNGQLDTSFGTAGRVTTDFGNAESVAAVLIQPDMLVNGAFKIVAAGNSQASSQFGPVSSFALARYLAQ